MTTQRDAEAPRRPFYFFMVFWGPVHRGYFTDLCLASLLAPGNLPALTPERRDRFLICTTASDREALQSHPLFLRMTAHIEPVWIDMPSPTDPAEKMLVMSRGHKMMADMAFRDGALGVFLTADMVLSDGFIARLQEHALAGRRVVLVSAMRYDFDGFLKEAIERGLYRHGSPLVLSPRCLAGLAIRHLHSETIQYGVDSPWFGNISPVCPFWRIPGEQGLLIHNFSWAAMLVDYSNLRIHDTHTLETWTVDGDYVHRNFPDSGDIHVATDSDEMMLVGLTREVDLSYEFHANPLLPVPFVGARIRALIIADFKHNQAIDPLKRELLERPVRIHEHDLTDAWRKVEAQARRTLACTERPPSPRALLRMQNLSNALNDGGPRGPRCLRVALRAAFGGYGEGLALLLALAWIAVIDSFWRYELVIRVAMEVLRLKCRRMVRRRAVEP